MYVDEKKLYDAVCSKKKVNKGQQQTKTKEKKNWFPVSFVCVIYFLFPTEKKKKKKIWVIVNDGESCNCRVVRGTRNTK